MLISSSNIDELEAKKKECENEIINLCFLYDDSSKMYAKAEELYNNWYLIWYELCILNNGILPDYSILNSKDFPCIFTVNAKPVYFELDNKVLKEAAVKKEYYTWDEALTLVKWSVNNTRNNLLKLGYKYSLGGTCGFSQFSSLYPLECLGLEVTINNAASFLGCTHSFGTVIIPVLMNGIIVKKQILIDCTYSQFYELANCVENCFCGKKTPDAGYFIKGNTEIEEFVSKFIENGFCELTEENIRKYAYGLYFSARSSSGLDIDTINEEFNKIDFIKIINTISGEYDNDRDECLEFGDLNFEICGLDYKNK